MRTMAGVTALAAEAGPPAGRPSRGRLEVGYVTGDGAPFGGAGRGAGVAVRVFHAGAAVRRPEGPAPSERAVVVGDDRRACGFESWLERDHLMLLAFDPDVAGIASQPFWLRWPGETGSEVLASFLPE